MRKLAVMVAGSRVILRVAPATVLIFGLLFSPAMFVAGILVWRGEQVREAVALCGVYAVLLYWICGRTVELAQGRLVYRVLFTRRTIDLAGVEDVRIAAHPAPALELRRRGSREYVRAFIVKPFTTTGVAAILGHVRDSSPEVKLDRVARDVAEGRFDTVAREALRAMGLLRLALLVVGAVAMGAVIRTLLR